MIVIGILLIGHLLLTEIAALAIYSKLDDIFRAIKNQNKHE